MSKGENMSFLFLFIAGIVLAIGGVYFYLVRSDNDYQKVLIQNGDIAAKVGSLETKIKELIQNVDAKSVLEKEEKEASVKQVDGLRVDVHRINEEFKVMDVRQRSLEKKLNEMPHEIYLKTKEPIAVDIMSLPKRRVVEKKPLLERSGIILPHGKQQQKDH